MNEIKLLKKKTKAKSEGNHKLLIAITADLSELYMKSGQFQQAIDEFIDLADLHKLEKNNIEYAKANRAIGEAYLGLNNYNKALEHQKLYLDIAIREKNDIEVQRAYATIGHIYLTTYLENQVNPEENLNAAYKYFMKSMKLCESLSISKLEKADMQARLLSNLGLVKDSSGDYEKAIELFTTSINICKNNDIYEQLTRGHIALASLFDRQNDSGKSLQQYNLAIEAAKKLKDNVDLMCDALLAKSEALIKLGDFHSTKKILYKAYKLNSPNLQNRKIIERNLKAVVVMCRTEDKLIIESNNNKELKKLYEKMGDCACTLKNFSKALEYYKLMLTYAEKSGMSGRELSSCYYSLAETYKDNKMYNKAVEYFEKEYLLCTELKDRLNTLSNIADTKETANDSIIEIREIYDRAIQASKLDNNIKEERRMITRFIAYLKRVKDENGIIEMENKLDSLSIPYEEFSSDSESIISELSEDKENNIDLSNITDVSDESDNERNPVCDAHVPTGKRRSKNFIIKKNAKGESQLHVACINGKIPVVKHLLEQGHPVNLRDNSGWLPIHEACNHGHYEITKLLIEKGAALNDRGGVKCEGITPLYDAANNGHLKIVALLLESGASATIKSDNGDTPLNVLQLWHQKYPFVGEDFDLYQKIIKKLTDSLKKVGSTVTVESKQNDVFEETVSDEELEGENFSIRDSSPDFVDEYHEIMKNLGKKSSKSTYTEPKIPSSSKRSALILDDDLFDDWLEDDILPAKTTKKRKTSSLESLVTSTTMVTNSSSKSSPLKRLSDDDIRPVNYDVLDISNSPSEFISQKLPKKSIQSSLLDSGFNRKISSANKQLSSLQRHRSLESSSSAKQKKITTFSSFVEADSTVPQLVQIQNQSSQPQESIPNISLNTDLMVYVDVKIEEKLYRVPVLLSQIQSNTIGWLADQAAQKYARKECSKPSLEIETESGALLSDDDPLSLLFPLGTKQAETVVGRIIKLYMTPLVDRYRDACLQMKEGPNKELMTILEETSVKLNLCNRGFPSDILSPLCKALNHQTTLLELNISGNFIGNSCMTILCASLHSLVNLSCLNLSCTGLTAYHIIELVKMFSVSSGQILEKLKHLDLSNNYLKNNSLPHLIEITKKLKLETLNISNIALRNDVEIILELKDICNLNVSENHFFPEKFISTFISNKLTNLDISRTLCKNFSLISDDTFEHNIFASIECLNVSCTDLDDNGLYKILRSCTSKSFLKLNVSYNYLLTGISLRRLLEHTTLEEINLIGCDKILQYFPEDFGRTIIRTKKNKIKLLFSYIDQMSDNLINQFKIVYNDCLIENANNLLIISTKE